MTEGTTNRTEQGRREGRKGGKVKLCGKRRRREHVDEGGGGGLAEGLAGPHPGERSMEELVPK